MRVYHCDGPGCDNKCSPDFVKGWTKLKWSHYKDSPIKYNTGWFADEVRHFCPECSNKLKGFLDPIAPADAPSIDLTKVEPVSTDKFEPKKETEHYDKGYIWE